MIWANNHRELIFSLASLLYLPNRLSLQRVGLVSQQLRLILGKRGLDDMGNLDPELIISLLQRINSLFDSISADLGPSLANYVEGRPPGPLNASKRQLLASVLSLNSIPPPPQPLQLARTDTLMPPVKNVASNPLKMFSLLKHSPNPASP